MKQYIVDAFTDKLFCGNPAAICILDKWLSDDMMKNIAKENNLSETAFAVKENEKYKLRWFTPAAEIDLVGHATLACAFVILHEIEKGGSKIVFDTKSGDLTVLQKGDLYEMDFPAYSLKPVPVTQKMTEAIGAEPLEAYMGRDLLCVFENEDILRGLKPNMEKLKQLDGLLLQATAKATETDCISRSFAPKLNVLEDPVCGSGHCHIVPYWANKLQKNSIVAYQASERGGMLYCRYNGSRVILSGKAVLYSIADLKIEC